MQVVLVCLQPFRRNLPLKCVSQSEIAKNALKPLIFWERGGGSRLFKVIDVDTSKKLVVSACYDKQHVCAYLQLFSRKTSQYGENPKSLSHPGLDRYRSVTDRQTDRRTDTKTFQPSSTQV